MSHVAQQVREWAVTALTGYLTLPTPLLGLQKQIDTFPAVAIIPSIEENERADIHLGLERTLSISIEAIAKTLDVAETTALNIEKGLAASKAVSPATSFTYVISQREYVYDNDTDQNFFVISQQIDFVYYTDDNDPETFT